MKHPKKMPKPNPTSQIQISQDEKNMEDEKIILAVS